MHGEDQKQHGKQREQPQTKEQPRNDLENQKVPAKQKAKPANQPGKGCWNCGKAQCPKWLTKSSKQLLQISEDSSPKDDLQSKWEGQIPNTDQFWSK